MSEIEQKLLEKATTEIGYSEKADGYTKFGDWYYQNVDNSDTYFKTAPWCDMFLAWAARETGTQDSVGQFAYTVAHAEWFEDKGAFTDKPEPGAVVFFDWSKSNSIDEIDHVGLVEKVDGGKIFTIEANVDGGNLKRKERSDDVIVGYGIPSKVKVAAAPAPTPTQTAAVPPAPGKPQALSVPEGKASAAPAVAPKPPSADQAVFLQSVSVAQSTPLAELPFDPSAVTVPAAGILAALLSAALLMRFKTRMPALPIRVRRRGRHHHTVGRVIAQ